MTTSYLSLPPISYPNALDGADRSSLGEIVNEIKAVKDNKSLLVVKAKKGKGNLKKDHWTPVVGHEGGDKDDTRFGDSITFYAPASAEDTPIWHNHVIKFSSLRQEHPHFTVQLEGDSLPNRRTGALLSHYSELGTQIIFCLG
ncbi:hypothetical protein I203_103504 [Kwoniella mangroviensis CBS 8507]|uniref:uncharacterized protein n=1 Tax=Kwoniella mangroviensis CBS 8507 TaxID=1296122 RepID=UPI00080D6012|nr:uncharacterized protein I203_04396 [Kwoniella mangroviensis CBS 8507]OCF66818.1 hypothetical protein I203_04396 [Kwoniella mangroviensis CBS 8507]